MSIINILLFPSGSQVANEIYNAIKYEKNIECFGADYGFQNWSAYEMPHYDHRVPIYNELDKQPFIDALKTNIANNNISCIVPCFDKFITILKELEHELGCTVAAPNINITKCCESKLLTYNKFRNIVTVPQLFNIEEIENKSILDKPLFIKPNKGYGSRDSYLIKNIIDFSYYKNKYNLKDFVICEYLPGDEFTVDCLSLEDKLLICNPRKRIRTIQGISVNTEVVLDKIIIDNCLSIGNSIVNILNIKGAWFFQVKFNSNGLLCLLEIAPRIPGAMCLTRNLGVNLPLLSIYIYLNKNVIFDSQDTCFARKPFSVYKTFKNTFLPKIDFKILFIDLDDTIIIKNKVNIDCISFIYHCKNNNKKIICLTRNINPVYKLNYYNISISLFDSINIVAKGETKSNHINNYINNDYSIFIDDSYMERKDVQSNCKNIEVFSLDQIESLF
jgi:hypothetical protein